MIKSNRNKQTALNFHENESLIDDCRAQDRFNFDSITQYDSIFKYKSSNQLLYKADNLIVNETKPIQGLEKAVYNSIVFTFYVLLVLLMPFSLFVCLKKVKNNEKFVVYRLGHTLKPAYEPGYCILFPFIDTYERVCVAQKEFSIPNLEIFNHENCIIEVSTQIRYQINDVIRLKNNIADLNGFLKPMARGLLVKNISKKSSNKLEQELYYVKEEIKDLMNNEAKILGLEIRSVEISILSISQDESQKSTEDPALKTISSLFKSLLSSTNNENDDSSSNPATKNIAPTILSMFQSMQTATKSETNELKVNHISPQMLIKLIEPLINEKSVQQIHNIYEFHIKSGQDSNRVEVFHINLKHGNGSIGSGYYHDRKSVGCMIKISENDMNDLFMDKLKPLNAYMSGQIEIDGSLQDVLRLKNLITSSITLPK